MCGGAGAHYGSSLFPADWSPWPNEASSEVYSPECHAVHAVLQEWFLALEDGSAAYRFPLRAGPFWTDEQLDALVVEIDRYTFQQASWAHNTRRPSIDSDAGPGYARLAPLQRQAFAQDLFRVLKPRQVIDASPPYSDYC